MRLWDDDKEEEWMENLENDEEEDDEHGIRAVDSRRWLILDPHVHALQTQSSNQLVLQQRFNVRPNSIEILSLLSVAITVNRLLESHKQSYQKRTKEEGRKQENEFIKTIDSICGHALGDEGNDSSIFINRSNSYFMVMEPLDYTSIIWFQFPEKECGAFPKASGNATKLAALVLSTVFWQAGTKREDPTDLIRRNQQYSTIQPIVETKQRFFIKKELHFTICLGTGEQQPSLHQHFTHFSPSSLAFSSRSQELQSGGYIVLLLCSIAWTVYGTQKVPAILLDPSIKWYVQNHLGSDLNFKAPTDVILVASAAFSALMFAVCIKILNFQHR
ncbi:hypothetical protein EZV62_028038 [Acer yangbiense]|uniref:Uncharacterized protein n=1 Tax=Acer yangbiense TaxID=1000413 RepID=A0A5C7GPG7_9ROSI|nr:hypothetical protein EZV62_028038 [Acer yangbiense]